MFFDFPKFLKIGGGSRASYLGVDIGTTSIKMVELAPGRGKPILQNYGILENYGHLERPNSVIQTSSLKMIDSDVADLLKILMGQLKPKTRDVVASVPPFSSFTALLDVPAMSAEETAQAMQYQARSLVPLPISEVTIDWLTVGEYEDDKGTKKQQIFLVSVPNEEIKKYQAVFKMAGLSLRALEIEGLSLVRILTKGRGTTLIMDIGALSTSIAVGDGGFLKYSAQTDFAGSSLTQAVAKGLEINVRRAEDLKRQRGLKGTGGEYELSTLMLPYLDVILNEGKRVRDIYEKNYSPRSEAGRGKIEKVILSGGGANLLGIEAYVSDYFSLPAEKANPWDGVGFPKDLTPLLGELSTLLPVALGLGLKQFWESV